HPVVFAPKNHLRSVGLCELTRQTRHKICEAQTRSRAAECERPIFVSRTVIVVDGMLPGSAKSDLVRSSRQIDSVGCLDICRGIVPNEVVCRTAGAGD